MSYADDLEALINALVEDRAKELAARKTGKPVPGGVGSSLGGTSLSTDGVIDNGENGSESDGDDNEDLKDKLKPGDEPEKFKLYDCETNEEVTLDGVGGGGVGPAYPTGFENCEAPKPPTMADLDGKTIFVCRYYSNFDSNVKEEIVYALDKSAYTSKKPKALAMANAASSKECVGQATPTEVDNGTTGIYRCDLMAFYGGIGCRTDGRGYISEYRTSTSTTDKQKYIDSFELKWPAVDKNHLVWNKDKECFESLCAELNTQVSEKYKTCNDELILCDEDGNKVKVTIDGDEMKVTQAKHGQEATIKNGKVQSTKPLTPEQIARAFK